MNFKKDDYIYHIKNGKIGFIIDIVVRDDKPYITINMKENCTLGDWAEYFRPAQKCLVHECTNHKHQGSFRGMTGICDPCWEIITTGKIHPTTSFLRNLDIRENEIKYTLQSRILNLYIDKDKVDKIQVNMEYK